MEIEFDPAKDETNRAKHGVSLRRAAWFDFDSALISEDDREEYGEDRFLAIGRIGRRLHTLVFTVRSGVVRVISLRGAEREERERYAAFR